MARKKAQEEEEASTSSSEHDTMNHDSEEEQDGNSSEEHSETEEQSDDDGSDDEEETAETPAPTATTDGEASTFALADLTSFNTHQINASQLYSPSTSTDTVNHYNNATISTSIAINESYLLSKAVVGTKQLLKQLWKCPSDKSSDGGFMVAKLPGRSGKVDGYVLPRMLVSVYNLGDVYLFLLCSCCCCFCGSLCYKTLVNCRSLYCSVCSSFC
jgi:hypothetical protein